MSSTSRLHGAIDVVVSDVGSLYMHREVKPGMHMNITHPSNMFPLDKRAPRHLMLAGGIAGSVHACMCMPMRPTSA